MDNLIYVDSDRLQYLDWRFFPDSQIATTSRELEASLSITGPTARGKQTQRYRPPTVLEQIARVRTSLQKAGELSAARPKPDRGRDTELHYIEETLEAFQAIVPAGPAEDPRSRPLTFWYVPATEVFGPLILLQDARPALTGTFNASTHSSYSVLQSFLFYARKDVDRSRLRGFLPKVPAPEYAEVDETHLESAIEETRSARNHCVEFAKDAQGLLSKWGLPPSGPHRIRALYWVREYGEEDGLNQRIGIFGYPVAIERLPIRLRRNRDV